MLFAASIFRSRTAQALFYECANTRLVIFRMAPQAFLMICGCFDSHDGAMPRQHFGKCCRLRYIEEDRTLLFQLSTDPLHHLCDCRIGPMIEESA